MDDDDIDQVAVGFAAGAQGGEFVGQDLGGEAVGDALARTPGEAVALRQQLDATRSAEDVLSTLVHEMAHLWQHHFGKPSRSTYHNREWAAKMDTLGLCPSDTGQPGGKRTGQSMSHYVVAGGPFAQACAALLAEGFAISWRDRARAHAPGKRPGKAGVRTKYTCPDCGLNAWAKPEAVLLCGACEVALEPEEA